MPDRVAHFVNGQWQLGGVVDKGMLMDPILFLIIVPVVLLAIYLGLFPIYRVWYAHKRGEADLAKAQNEQQIQVAMAKGRLAAADLNKQAAIIEAEAVAEQISRIGEKLVSHDLYLRWQWIKMMEDRDGGETIYVPTEANLPLLEAARLMPIPKES
jgi:hypothetical protein